MSCLEYDKCHAFALERYLFNLAGPILSLGEWPGLMLCYAKPPFFLASLAVSFVQPNLVILKAAFSLKSVGSILIIASAL